MSNSHLADSISEPTAADPLTASFGKRVEGSAALAELSDGVGVGVWQLVLSSRNRRS